MKTLIISENKYPSNRPMLISLWNQEFKSRGNKVYWIFRSDKNTESICKTVWNNSLVFLLPNVDKLKYGFMGRFVFLIKDIWLKYKLSSLLIKKYEIDIMHCHDTCFEGLVAYFNKIRLGTNISFGYTAPFIEMKKEVAFNYKGIKYINRYLWYLLIRTTYSFIFKKSDLVFPISESLGSKIKKEYNLSNDKVLAVGECASELFLSKEKVFNPDKKIFDIIYVGSIFQNRKLDVLIRSFKTVLDEIPNINLIFLGWSNVPSDIDNLKSLATRLGILDKIQFLGLRPYNEVPDIILNCDVGISPIPPTDIFIDSTPTKAVEYLSLGIPVVANREIPDQRYLLEKSGGGILVDYSSKSFAEGILKLIRNPRKSFDKGMRGKSWISKNRTFKSMSQKIEKKYLETIRN